MNSHYDVVVLGAGPGGYVAAIRAAHLGLSTAVVEEKYWGGVCLNVGCIPSKALLRHAEIAHLVTDGASMFGIEGVTSVDFGVAFDRSRSVADGRTKGVNYLMKKNGIRQYNGRGVFRGPNTLEVSGVDSATITFDNVIIASGAEPRLLPGTTRSDNVVTYEEQILTRELPKSVVIAGAGAIGVEFAYVLNSFGVDVTLVEYAERILPLEDADVSAELSKRYKKSGITILVSTSVEEIVDSGGQVKVVVRQGGEARTLLTDKVVQAIGFVPRTDGYGLETTGVELTERGAVMVDEYMRTSVPGIFAIGDVTAQLMLAHVAEAQGVVAAETIACVDTIPVDYPMIPRATFCQPQVASFGWTEQQARDKAGTMGWDVKVATFPFSANGKAHGLGDAVGFVKLISDDTYGELLGGHLIGPEVTELLPELTLAQKFELTVEDLVRNVHAHPTLSEALQEAFHGLAGHMINL
ncbi:dihydrolipoyl dehydrogenase [Rhodococcus erythropolis SK121]|nr:dihydrolipoyl dehydrogenase [Rhodococcus erythropolis SK121]